MEPTTFDGADDFDAVISLHGVPVPDTAPASPPAPRPPSPDYRFPADEFELPSIEYQPRLRRSA